MSNDILSEKTNILYCSVQCTRDEEPDTSESEFIKYTVKDYIKAYDEEILFFILEEGPAFVCGTASKAIFDYTVQHPYSSYCRRCGRAFYGWENCE